MFLILFLHNYINALDLSRGSLIKSGRPSDLQYGQN